MDWSRVLVTRLVTRELSAKERVNKLGQSTRTTCVRVVLECALLNSTQQTASYSNFLCRIICNVSYVLLLPRTSVRSTSYTYFVVDTDVDVDVDGCGNTETQTLVIDERRADRRALYILHSTAAL